MPDFKILLTPFASKLSCILRSSTIIKYIFNTFIFSKRSLHKKLLNIYLIEVDERNNNHEGTLFKMNMWLFFISNNKSTVEVKTVKT